MLSPRERPTVFEDGCRGGAEASPRGSSATAPYPDRLSASIACIGPPGELLEPRRTAPAFPRAPGPAANSASLRGVAMASTVTQPTRGTAPWQDAHGVQPGAAAGGRGRLRAATARWSRPPSARAPAGCCERASALGEFVGGRAPAGVGPPGQREQAGAAHPRPLRQPHRRGRVPSRLASADADGRGARAALAAVDQRASPSRTRRAPRCT